MTNAEHIWYAPDWRMTLLFGFGTPVVEYLTQKDSPDANCAICQLPNEIIFLFIQANFQYCILAFRFYWVVDSFSNLAWLLIATLESNLMVVCKYLK